MSGPFPLSARPLGLGRNSLNTSALATMDFRVLKYFPFGRVKGHDVVGRSAFVQYIMAESETLAFTNADPAGPWQAFVMRHVVRAVNDGDLTSFVGGLRGEAWMLADACTKFQVGLIERAVLRDREAFITALLDVDPAVLRRRVPPLSQAIEFAFTYAKTRLLPTLLRIWRVGLTHFHSSTISGSAWCMMSRTFASVFPRQSPSSLILSSINAEADFAATVFSMSKLQFSQII